MRTLRALWRDESGFIVTSELLTIVTVVVIGSIAGYVAIRDALLQECGDIAAAIGALRQSYAYNGVSNRSSAAFTRGASFTDVRNVPTSPGTTGAIMMNVPPTSEE